MITGLFKNDVSNERQCKQRAVCIQHDLTSLKKKSNTQRLSTLDTYLYRSEFSNRVIEAPEIGDDILLTMAFFYIPLSLKNV